MAVLTTATVPPIKIERASFKDDKSKPIKTLWNVNEVEGRRPWYRRGGMHVNMIGMAINIFTPVLLMACSLERSYQKAFCGVLLGGILSALMMGMKTVYCILVVPTFFSSLLLLPSLGGTIPALLLLSLSVALAIVKVNICMSVCLHRWAAHSAFKCGPKTSFVMMILGCLANQGGPIWWASQHRCHHKYCDLPRDPHSPIISGVEKAFAFFELHQEVQEEFVPRHLESILHRIIDTWSWTFHSLQLTTAYLLFSNQGLFIAFTSGWLSQTITLWFNVANHPPFETATCKASNDKASPTSLYLPFYILDMLYPLFSFFVAEGEHQHHHDHATLAKRCPNDTAYWCFLFPLEHLGLIWKVNVND